MNPPAALVGLLSIPAMYRLVLLASAELSGPTSSRAHPRPLQALIGPPGLATRLAAIAPHG